MSSPRGLHLPRVDHTIPLATGIGKRILAWQDFERESGVTWELGWEPTTAIPSIAISSGLEILSRADAADKKKVLDVSRTFLEEHASLYGLQAEDLVVVNERVRLSPDQRTWTVDFAQSHDGVPVRGAFLSLRIKDGKLAQIRARVFPDIPCGQSCPVRRKADEAREVIFPTREEGGYRYDLAKRVRWRRGHLSQPWVKYETDEGKILAATSFVRHFSGEVIGEIYEDGPVEMDGTPRAPVWRPIPGISVLTREKRIATTDGSGRFSFSGGAPLGEMTLSMSSSVTTIFRCGAVEQEGRLREACQFLRFPVPNLFGAISSGIGIPSLSGVVKWVAEKAGLVPATELAAADVRLVLVKEKPPKIDERVKYVEGVSPAARSAAYHFERVREAVVTGKWVGDHPWNHGPLLVSVDISARSGLPGEPCNANWDGVKFNFYSDGFVMDGNGVRVCNDTVLVPSVVYHEAYHAFDTNFTGGDEAREDGALNEGTADFFSSLLTNDSRVGKGIFKKGSVPIRKVGDGQIFENHVRDIAQAGPDGNPYHFKGRDNLIEDPHEDGLTPAGAEWDYYLALREKYGPEKAREIAGRTILSAVETEPSDYVFLYYAALLHDDSDANLLNGTPHFAEITRAFASRCIADARSNQQYSYCSKRS